MPLKKNHAECDEFDEKKKKINTREQRGER